MGANDPRGEANLDPRGMIGRIYVGYCNAVDFTCRQHGISAHCVNLKCVTNYKLALIVKIIHQLCLCDDLCLFLNHFL